MVDINNKQRLQRRKKKHFCVSPELCKTIMIVWKEFSIIARSVQRKNNNLTRTSETNMSEYEKNTAKQIVMYEVINICKEHSRN